MLHVARSRARPFRQLMIPAHGPRLARSLVAFARPEPGPHLLHGIGLWTWSALAAARALARDGVACEVVASVYTTYRHESAGKLRGLDAAHGMAEGLRWRLEHLFTRAVVARYERRAYRGARLVLVNYASVARLLVDELGPGLAIRRMPYSIESEFAPPPGAAPAPPAALASLAPAEAPLVVSLSRHDPRKGVDVLLRALAELARRRVAFRAALLSGGRLLEAHRALAARLGLGGRVLLPGWVEDPQAWLRHADVLALPSLQEGSGSLALLEAMRLGVPSVVSEVDGLPEDLPDGDGGLLVPPGRPEPLADALARLFADPALRARLGARARERFERGFGAARMVRALGELYAELGFPAEPSDAQQVRAWLRDFAAAVRARDYAAGRALFASDARGFGTAVELAEGLDALEARQWRRVWDVTRDFDFGPASLRIEVSGGLAFASALWSSTGLGEAGPFPRAGRATIVLARRGPGWLAVHSHFSLDPEAGHAAT